MGGQIAAAPIERQVRPATRKGGPAAVAILQVLQPVESLEDVSLPTRWNIEMAESEKRAGRIIGIGHAPWQICPGPPARIGSRVSVTLPVLLFQQPVRHIAATIEMNQLACRCQRID